MVMTMKMMTMTALMMMPVMPMLAMAMIMRPRPLGPRTWGGVPADVDLGGAPGEGALLLVPVGRGCSSPRQDKNRTD